MEGPGTWRIRDVLRTACRGLASARPRAPPIVDHRDPMHTAILGQIVGDSIVLGDTVIPHRHRPALPAEADLKLGLIEVVEQRRQEPLTVAAGHPQHVRGEMTIDVEKRLPGHGVVGDDRMHRCSHGRHALIETFETALGEKLIPVGARRMYGEEVAEIRFHAVWERVIGSVHTAPERIPPTGRNGGGVQNRGKRRTLNLSHFVARKHWPRSEPSSLHFRAHRLQRREPLRGLLVPMATIFALLQTAIN